MFIFRSKQRFPVFCHNPTLCHVIPSWKVYRLFCTNALLVSLFDEVSSLLFPSSPPPHVTSLRRCGNNTARWLHLGLLLCSSCGGSSTKRGESQRCLGDMSGGTRDFTPIYHDVQAESCVTLGEWGAMDFHTEGLRSFLLGSCVLSTCAICWRFSGGGGGGGRRKWGHADDVNVV